ncbi:hypothetical protein RJT34_07827 [Clitoria ternatea]|uniref:Uncharacterized protein n=1 Tax=Clitoria ternatea TaxID=43366 RepID=A0AAN9K3U0_CLITE
MTCGENLYSFLKVGIYMMYSLFVSWQKECEELHTNAEILKDENSLLRQRLIRLSEECMELSNENVSIQEELVELYGPESVADLLPGELPDSVAGGHQNS